jgi:hypothetical protein
MVVEKLFFNWPITNKNYLWRPWKFCTGEVVSDEKIPETRIAYGGHVGEVYNIV